MKLEQLFVIIFHLILSLIHYTNSQCHIKEYAKLKVYHPYTSSNHGLSTSKIIDKVRISWQHIVESAFGCYWKIVYYVNKNTNNKSEGFRVTKLKHAIHVNYIEPQIDIKISPDIDVNRRNNDRLTCFMLAMQSSILPTNISGSSTNVGGSIGSLRGTSTNQMRDSESATGATPPRQEENAQEKLRRLMDLPATDDLEWSRQDRHKNV